MRKERNFLFIKEFPDKNTSQSILPITRHSSLPRGFRGSSIPYEEFKDEPGSTCEEVKTEPQITFDCAYCDYRSPTQKGLRCHHITVHKIGVGVRRTLDTHGRPLTYFGTAWCSTVVISASIRITPNQNSGCLDHKFGHISHFLDTIKCTYIGVLQCLFGPQVWSYQSLPGHINTTYSTAFQWLFGLQVWYLPGHIKSINNAALHWLFRESN
ncbi:uncharacterized protein TNIN_363911 [Trichonephila inaurata madagascariensis]|uniref:Uncharacterized protein n=1 Tax=Trichonephila inaurata madagascariensis TaxID=2747483 RepID=A0A8X6YV20_9ARAC|nr:uncharacterized protein TNIN_363911 [Trichonephila inaurata madagascariensis]